MTTTRRRSRGPVAIALLCTVQLLVAFGLVADRLPTAPADVSEPAATTRSAPVQAGASPAVEVATRAIEFATSPVDLAAAIQAGAPEGPGSDLAAVEPALPAVQAAPTTAVATAGDERPVAPLPAAPAAPAPPPAPPPEPPPPAGPAASEAFAATFGAHEAAEQVEGAPETFRWAVLIGVNAYQGRTSDTLGSVADVEVLRDHLIAEGWHPDHILVLTDHMATRSWIIEALGWLQRKTDDRSTVTISYSGHLRHRGGVSALWPTDNAFIWADELGRLLEPIRAEQMWVSLQGCHAAGLRAPGVEAPGRVVTYSSEVVQKSYEDPEVGQSVAGFYLFTEALTWGWGDEWGGDGDGHTSIQEAFAWAAPRAEIRTSGLQRPVIADHLGSPLHLGVPEG